MGRPRKAKTVHFDFMGVVISLYRNTRGTWEAGFTVPGKERDKAYGPTEAACRKNACDKIRGLLGVEGYAVKSDEDAARRILEPHEVTMAEAARFWAHQHSQPLTKATLGEVRTDWLKYLGSRKDRNHYHHVRALTQRSRHLLEKFQDRQIGTMSVVELTLWQDALEADLAARTVRNIHDAAKDLWRFARKRGYLMLERKTAIEQLDRPRAKTGNREVFWPGEMQLLMDAGWGRGLPGACPLAIQGFGSVRAEELCGQNPDEPLEHRLTWEDVIWAENYIRIRREVSKTDDERKAGLPENLRAMLYPIRGSGPIYPGTRLDLAYQAIATVAGVQWKHNAPRHSCLTYHMLLAPNATEVANRAGTSVVTIEMYYRNRHATREQAVDWFSLKPRAGWRSAASVPR
jgi:hypothetical protein